MADEVSAQLQQCNRKGRVPPMLQLLLTLRFYACGTFQGSWSASTNQPNLARSPISSTTVQRQLTLLVLLIPLPVMLLTNSD